ncbi:MAG: adenylate/guanylate cyclase domain-containing protein [Candidatus Tumulicola sp.]
MVAGMALLPGTTPGLALSFLFSDIEGSAILWERRPDDMTNALADHDQIMNQATLENGGRVFKTVGDAFCCVFTNSGAALVAATSAQRSLQRHPWPKQLGALRVRMGIHTGSAVERDGDYFGPTVNRTARIMSVAYGDQILVSSVTAESLTSGSTKEIELRDLGRHRLRDLREAETIYQAIAEGLRADFPPLRSVDSRANNLPCQISTFIGRESELSELSSLLRAHRLLTITGAGGMGKTRLSLQLAAGAIGEYKDGAWFIDLSGVNDPSLVAQSFCAQLNAKESSHELLSDTLLRYLKDRQLLLVVDNAEHLLEAVASTVKPLLEGCPLLSVVVTSREPLHVPGEQVYRLAPMSGPDADSDATALSTRDSTLLFLERAREAVPDFVVGDADTADVISLCRRLENIPLAIELAAARVTVLTVEQLNRRLSPSLDLLSSRSKLNDRHRTLESTIDWSYRLLTDDEKVFFESLSIFVDGFSLEACEAIGIRDDSAACTLDLLQSLIEKSLVSTRASGASPRYQMLDVIRHFAERRASVEPRCASMHQRHYRFFLGLVAGGGDVRSTLRHGNWINAIATDIGNCRAALEWALHEKVANAGQLICSLAAYWQDRSQLTEGRLWLARFLAEFPETATLFARVLRFAAFFAACQDDYDEATRYASHLQTIAAHRGDKLMEAEALHSLAVTENRRGNIAKAVSQYGEALALFDAAGDKRSSLITVLNLINALVESRELLRCNDLLERAEHLIPIVTEVELTALALGLRGILALRYDRLSEAEAFIRQALSIQTSLGSARRVEDLNSLAEVRARQGATAEAIDIVRESLALSVESEEHNNVIRSLEVFSFVLFSGGRDDESIKSLAAARALRDRYSYRSQALFGGEELEAALRKNAGDNFEVLFSSVSTMNWKAIAGALLQAPASPVENR